MHVLVDFSVVPLGVGVSVAHYVALCQRVLEEASLTHSLYPAGTLIEGEWDAVFAAVKRCHQVVHAAGAPRIHTTMRVGTRTDHEESGSARLTSVARAREAL